MKALWIFNANRVDRRSHCNEFCQCGAGIECHDYALHFRTSLQMKWKEKNFIVLQRMIIQCQVDFCFVFGTNQSGIGSVWAHLFNHKKVDMNGLVVRLATLESKCEWAIKISISHLLLRQPWVIDLEQQLNCDGQNWVWKPVEFWRRMRSGLTKNVVMSSPPSFHPLPI